MKVFILTTHHEIDPLFGSTCVFNSLRVGFPNAEIIVFDNASDCGAQEIKAQAHKNDCRFIPYYARIGHHEFIQRRIEENDGPICFVDPDVIFYKEVENYTVIGDIAGRFCPSFYNEVVQAQEAARLHTSLLFIKDTKALKEKLNSLHQRHNYPFNPYAPFIIYAHGQRYFYDTCANLCHAIANRQSFDEEMLDRYTHLVSGSMLDHVSNKMKHGARLRYLHRLAKENPELVRGLWRELD